MKTNFARRSVALSSAAGLLLAVVPFAPAEAQWVFVARKAAQRIHHMVEQGQNGQPGYDFATVILEAPADKVFDVALGHARNNRTLRLLMVDPAGMRLQVAEGDRTATLNVVSLGDQTSQLMIAGTAGRGEDPTSSRVVAAVMRVCAEMKKTCSVGR
ncbi:hypothetical protein [Enhydrobacter sp.]|uniref:hypothetical protein n=1 Tax=Enhydrobacter sp. TaxID=1894999 RepID=UPI00262461D7|nr:hypothetical protein [Enhydrobacter sp.]WIM14338.1 MAG: hypothetical protein OJF58_005308 [Enhydrobacter sp.]